MQRFFNDPMVIQHRLIDPVEWNYLRANLKRNLHALKTYYLERVFAVKSNHILVSLLTHLDLSMNMTMERYAALVEARAPYLAQVFKMTSAMNHGIIHPGHFYNPDDEEILILDQASFSLSDALRNWKQLSPVQVISHGKSDLRLLLPNGKKKYRETTMNIVSIHITKLALQYRCFLMDAEKNAESGLSIAHFIYRHVLPNMLDSHLEHCLYNRLRNLAGGFAEGEVLMKNSLYLPSYDDQVDVVMVKVLRAISRAHAVKYSTILQTIPAVNKPSMLEVMRLPEQAATIQYAWVEFIARSGVVELLHLLTAQERSSVNQSVDNYFQREYLFFKNARSHYGRLPQAIQSYLDHVFL